MVRSTTGPFATRRVPTLISSPATSRAPQRPAALGGSSVSASSTSRRTRRIGRSPNASSARRAVPKRLVTSRKSDRATLVKISAGPAGGDDATVNLGGFEVGIDRRLHRDDVVVTAELVEEGAQIGKRPT